MSRLSSFAQNIKTLGTVMDGPAPAAAYILRSKIDKSLPARAHYSGQAFTFRRDDIPAVREVLETREYDPLAGFFIKNPVPEILDAGAHIGLFALWALSVNANARILSVEANTENFSWLSKNRTLAQSRYPGWDIMHGAAWRDDQGVSFISEGPTMSRRVGGDSAAKMPSFTLPALLDRLAPNGDRIDLAKIDIEGAEEAFITAYPEALQRIDTLVVELHPKLCDTAKVQTALAQSFTKIAPIDDRLCAKPLLVCTRT